MDRTELLKLLQTDPQIRAIVASLATQAVPSRAIIGTSSPVPLKGFRAASEPAHYWEKE